MAALIVYGSLINKKELLEKNISLDRCTPIKIHGFKREFSQEPSWRKSDSINRAVLTVFTNINHFINAILIEDISKDELKQIDHRERGYDRLKIDNNDIEFAYTNKKIILDDVYIYVGKKEKYNNKILPNQPYFELCEDGAKDWSSEFYDDFVTSTYSNNNF